MPYSYKELSAAFHGSEQTLRRRIKELKQAGKFDKKSTGKFFDEGEAKNIAELLNFTFTNGKTA